jgi:DNA topoisomerase I
VSGAKVKFRFKGKSGILHDVAFEDPHISRIIRHCQDLPGEELFAYEDEDGNVYDVGSSDVNSYLKSITGEPITAKDFRTWGGTVRAVEILAGLGKCEQHSKRARKSRECEVIKEAASALNNTVAICRKYYVHPAVFAADEDGFLHKAYGRRKKQKTKSAFSVAEQVTLDILKRSGG